jgi:hypothetical protein
MCATTGITCKVPFTYRTSVVFSYAHSIQRRVLNVKHNYALFQIKLGENLVCAMMIARSKCAQRAIPLPTISDRCIDHCCPGDGQAAQAVASLQRRKSCDGSSI